MNSPRIGQTWSIKAFGMGRYTFVITAIDGPTVRGLIKGTQRTTQVPLRTLVRGLRAARLELEADGSKPYVAPEQPPRQAEYTRTASDYRKESPPRSLSAEERKAWAQARAEGKPWP